MCTAYVSLYNICNIRNIFYNVNKKIKIKAQQRIWVSENYTCVYKSIGIVLGIQNMLSAVLRIKIEVWLEQINFTINKAMPYQK